MRELVTVADTEEHEGKRQLDRHSGGELGARATSSATRGTAFS